MTTTPTAKDVERGESAATDFERRREFTLRKRDREEFVEQHAQALADERERAAAIIRDLLKACDELMTEFVSKKRAANWGVINAAMVKGAAAIRGATP